MILSLFLLFVIAALVVKACFTAKHGAGFWEAPKYPVSTGEGFHYRQQEMRPPYRQ